MRSPFNLAIRSEAMERMDNRSIGGEELAQALVQLRRINRLVGAHFPTLEGVTRLWRRAGRPERLSVLDVGAGLGDANRSILRWADRRRIDVRITLVDAHPETCERAAAYYADEPRVQVEQGDLFDLAPGRSDIVTASLVLHHIATSELPSAVRSMREAARIGIVINDLHRHWLAWASIWIGTRLFSRNRMIRNDAPLSVRRGFRSAEIAALRGAPDLRQIEIRWRPLFRYLILLSGEAPAHVGDRTFKTYAPEEGGE